MPVLAQRSFFSRPYPISKRSSRRSKQGARSPGMETPDFYHENSEFLRISRLLPPIHPRFFQDCEAHDEAPPEGSKVQLDFWLWSSILAVEDFVDHCTSPNSAQRQQAVWCLLWCIRNRPWVCFDARRKDHCICLPPMEKTWRALCDPWPRVSCCGSHFKDLATLPFRQCLSYLYGSQKPQVYLHLIRVEHEAAKMVGIDQGL